MSKSVSLCVTFTRRNHATDNRIKKRKKKGKGKLENFAMTYFDLRSRRAKLNITAGSYNDVIFGCGRRRDLQQNLSDNDNPHSPHQTQQTKQQEKGIGFTINKRFSITRMKSGIPVI